MNRTSMFRSFCEHGSATPPYRSVSHPTNPSETSTTRSQQHPFAVCDDAVGWHVFQTAPSSRRGVSVPGSIQVVDMTQHRWHMIGLEHHNAFTAMSPTTSTRIPPTVVVINVINLDHRPERWNSVQRLGLDKQDGGFVRLKRFSAVRTQRGWVGCARSHIRLVHTCISTSTPKAYAHRCGQP
jgi:hypothetical protein